jgi:hypothetical protein
VISRLTIEKSRPSDREFYDPVRQKRVEKQTESLTLTGNHKLAAEAESFDCSFAIAVSALL